jgi:protein-disulfide isomerase
VILSLCAVVLTAATVRTLYYRSRLAATEPSYRVPEWRNYAAAGYETGSKTAPVTLVVFNDYQCPVCQRTADRIEDLLTSHPQDLRVIVRSFPLTFHEQARIAAAAAECAAQQDYFWPMHRLLFRIVDTLEQAALPRHAAGIGVPDSTAFRDCLASDRVKVTVAREIDAGEQLRVSVTPTLLINDDMYIGAPSDLERLIERKRKAVTDD